MKKVTLFMGCLFLLLVVACQKDENASSTKIQATGLDALQVLRKSATLKGSMTGQIDTKTIKEFGFMYSTVSSLLADDVTTKRSSIKDGNFSLHKEYRAELMDLEPGKTYYYCMYVSNGNTILKSDVLTFDTQSSTKPQFSDMKVDLIGEYNISVSCSITDDGGSDIIQCGFSYKKSSEDDSKYIDKSVVSIESFVCTLDNLSPGTSYDIRPFATNRDGKGYGNMMPLVTEGFEAPVVVTQKVEVSALGANWVTLSGIVSDKGVSELKVRGFYYGVNNPPTKPVEVGSEEGPYSVKITNLAPGTKYYFRAYATNGSKTGLGDILEFTTTNLTKPTITETAVQILSQTSIHIQAKIDDGNGDLLEKGFCYGTSTNPIPTEENGGTCVRVSDFKDNWLQTEIDNLQPATTYYIRAYAKNSIAKEYGEIKEFKTISDPKPVVTNLSITNVSSTSLSVNADVKSSIGITKRGFVYSETNAEPTLDAGDVKDFVSSSGSISNLKPNTTYYIRAYAANEAGLVYSSVKTAKTLTMPLPRVTQSEITRTGSTVKATAFFASEGGTISEYGVCYSTTNTVPTTADTKKQIDGNGSSMTGYVSDLASGTTYYFRVYVTSNAGTGYGDVKKITVGSSIPGESDNGSPEKN